MKNQTFIALKLLSVMTILTGIIYPLLITGVAQVGLSRKANGSLLIKNGVIIGSELLGQKFDEMKWFWPRPSATDYNTLPSGGSNLGPTSDKLKKTVSQRRASFGSSNMITDIADIPSEMLLTSASGLDPHISPDAARIQVVRIANARNFDNDKKLQIFVLIKKLTQKPQFSIFGETRINVLLLNLELEKI
jgi:potassium-transporting ATPase KdpC subunit